MVGGVEEALALRADGIGQFCVGEVDGKAPPGFDFGNSPFEILEAARTGTVFGGKTIIQRTSGGTQGIGAAQANADRLYAASLVTAGATARPMRSSGADLITLVAMGNRAIVRPNGDEVWAIQLRNLLEGGPGDPDAVRRLILAGREIAHFHDPARPHLHPRDLDIALDIDRFDFAVAVATEDGIAIARRENPLAELR